MKIINPLTTDSIIMYINIPTDKGTESYMVEIDRPDMDEDVYYVRINELTISKITFYSKFKINPEYKVLSTNELDEREELLLEFIEDRLLLDEV